MAETSINMFHIQSSIYNQPDTPVLHLFGN